MSRETCGMSFFRTRFPNKRHQSIKAQSNLLQVILANKAQGNLLQEMRATKAQSNLSQAVMQLIQIL